MGESVAARLARVELRTSRRTHQGVVVVYAGETVEQAIAKLAAAGRSDPRYGHLVVFDAGETVDQWEQRARAWRAPVPPDAPAPPPKAIIKPVPQPSAASSLPRWKQQELADKQRPRYGTRDIKYT